MAKKPERSGGGDTGAGDGVSFAERDELLTGGGKRRRRGKHRWLKRSALAIVVVLVLLVGVVGLFGPSLASKYAPGIIASASSDAIQGRVEVSKVSLSWSGPQRVEGVRLLDPDGNLVAELTATAGRGLLGLATDWKNISGIVLTGNAEIVGSEDRGTNLQRAIEPRPGRGGSTSGSGPRASGTKAGVRAFEQMVIDAKIENFQALYRARPGDEPIGLTDLDATIRVDRGVVNIDATGVTTEAGAEPVKVTIVGDNLLDASGKFDPKTAEARVTVTAAVGDETLERLGKAYLGEDRWRDTVASAGAAGGAEEVRGLRVFADVKLENGRIVPADATKPSFIRGRVPAGLVAGLLGAAEEVRITRTPDVQLTVATLDIPLTNAEIARNDFRGAAFEGELRVGAVEGAMRVGGQERAVRMEPLRLTVATKEGGEVLGAAGGTNWRIGSDEGRLSIDAMLTGLLDDSGRMRAPERFSGEVIAAGVPSGLIQPMLGENKIRVSDAVGEVINVQARATVSPGGAASSAEGRPVQVTLAASGEHGSLEAEFNYDSDRITSRGGGVRVQQYNLAPIARALIGEKAAVAGEGVLLAQVSSFEIPLQKGAPSWALASFEAEAHVGDLAFTPAASAATATLKDQGVTLSQKRGGSLEMSLTYDKGEDGRAVGVGGTLSVAGMYSENPAIGGPFDFKKARVSGEVSADDLSTELLALALEPADVSLAREALGATMDLAVRADGASAGAPGELARIEFSSASGQTISTTVKAEARRWAIGPTTGTVRVSPALFAMADDRFGLSAKAHEALAGGDDAAPTRLSLRAPAEFDVSAQPIGWATDEQTGLPRMATDPDGGQRPDLVGSRQIMLTARTPVEVAGIPNPLKTPEAGVADFAVGLRELVVAHLSHENAPAEDESSLKAVAYDPANPSGALMSLDAVIRSDDHAAPLEVAVTGADTPGIERLIGRPGYLQGAVGTPVSLRAMKENLRDRGIEVLTASIDAPRLKGASITLAGADGPARMGIARPATIEWTPTNAWVAENFFGGGGETAGGDAAVRVEGDVRMTIALERLMIATGEAGPMLPGVFDLSARVSTDSLTLVTRNGVRETLRGVFAAVTTGEAPGSLKAAFGADGAGGAKTLEGTATIADIADAQGNLTADRARLTARVNGSAPTAVVDAVLDRKGMLVDMLGPTSTLDVTAQELSKTGGRLEGAFSSEYSTVSLAGSVRDGVFVTEGQPRAELRIITEAASKRYFQSIFPIINSFEKSAADTPGVITASDLRIPVDGDIRKLNGVLRFDLGTAQFRTAPILGQVMKAIKAREAGQIGQKVPVFEVRLENGVARYDEVSLPIGDVTLRTYGKVSFVNRKVEIVVMIPFASVSDDLAATVGRLPFVGDLAVVPIKIVGDMDNPRTEFDPGLLVGNVIEKNPIGTILDQLNKERNRDDEKKNNNKPRND